MNEVVTECVLPNTFKFTKYETVSFIHANTCNSIDRFSMA